MNIYSSFPRGNAGNNLGPIRLHELSVKPSLSPGDSLHDDLRRFMNEDPHVSPLSYRVISTIC